MQHILRVTWGVSRGRDTYGYNIVTITDENGKKYRTCGGGYDMQGTVLADWLQYNYMDRVKERCKPVDYDNPYYDQPGFRRDEDYGFFTKGGAFWLDGGCGESSIMSLARKSGINIKAHWNERKKTTDIYTVEVEE